MIKDFECILKIIDKLNKNCGGRIILENDFEEQSRNIEDLKGLLKELHDVVERLEFIEVNDAKKVDVEFSELHRISVTLKWHIDEIHELILKMFKNYSDELVK